MLISSECGKVLKWSVGSGAAVASGGWGFVLVRSGEVVRSMSVLGLVCVWLWQLGYGKWYCE